MSVCQVAHLCCCLGVAKGCELPRTHIPGTWVNEGKKVAWECVSVSLFLATPLFRPYHPKVPPLQWHPARRTILNLLGVGFAGFEVVEEHPSVSPYVPPEVPPEPMPLRAWVVQDDHLISPPEQDRWWQLYPPYFLVRRGASPTWRIFSVAWELLAGSELPGTRYRGSSGNSPSRDCLENS